MSKPVKKRRNWTVDEDLLLQQNYSRVDNKRMQVLMEKHGFERTIHAIENRAKRLLISKDDIKGYVPAAWLVDHPGAATHNVVNKARKEGALKYLKNNKIKYFVTIEFADKMYAQRDQWRSNAEELAHWYTLKDLARVSNLSVSTISNYRWEPDDSLIGCTFKKIRYTYKLDPKKRVIFNPDDVHVAVKKYWDLRAELDEESRRLGRRLRAAEFLAMKRNAYEEI